MDPYAGDAPARRSKRFGRQIALIAAAVVVGSVATVSPAYAATRLGGINIAGACGEQYGGWAWLDPAIRPAAYGWRCLTSGPPLSVDLHRACRVQYNNEKAYAVVGNVADPYSWYCAKP